MAIKQHIFDNEGNFKGCPDYWQQFFICLLCHLLLPLLPLGTEWFTVGYLKTSTITLSASMYVIAIGMSSTNALEFIFCMLQGLIYALMFGHYSAVETTMNANQLQVWNSFSTLTVSFMGITLVLHLFSRYNRHIVSRSPFLEFMKEVRK